MIADGCCCSHGGRCACALKKEGSHLDPVPESDSDECSSGPSSVVNQARPRAHTTQSEGTGLTIFNNGHHKPAHKHNQMAHKCGLPYVVPRAHSIHGASTGNLANRSVDNLPHIGTIDALHSNSKIKDSIVSAQQEQRQIKSEHNSPTMSAGNFSQLNSQLPPLDLSAVDGFTDYNFPFCYDSSALPLATDFEAPIFSAGLSATSIDWSHYDGLDFNNNNNFATSEFSQAPSFTGFDFSSIDQPALTTTSTSGEISEVEDFGGFNDQKRPVRPNLATHQFGSDVSEFGEVNDGYRLSTASSFMGMPQVQMLASNDLGNLDIDDFLKGVTTNNGYVQANTSLPVTHNHVDHPKFTPTSSPFEDNCFQMPQMEDDEGLWMNNFSNSNNNNNLSMNTSTSAPSDLNNHNVWAQ